MKNDSTSKRSLTNGSPSNSTPEQNNDNTSHQKSGQKTILPLIHLKTVLLMIKKI